MKIEILNPSDVIPRGSAVVVIDVLRAFTTLAYAFSAGATEVSLAATVADARRLQSKTEGAQVMGEVGGIIVDGFDAGNSPAHFVENSVAPRWIQRTSAGTPAAVAASEAKHLLVASFVCASATVGHLRRLRSPWIVLVVSGASSPHGGDDDRACAEYLAGLLSNESPSAEPYIRRMEASPAASKFLDPRKVQFPRSDLTLAADVDRFNFAMVAVKQPEGELVVRPVSIGLNRSTLNRSTD